MVAMATVRKVHECVMHHGIGQQGLPSVIRDGQKVEGPSIRKENHSRRSLGESMVAVHPNTERQAGFIAIQQL
jgi:hypothetical protein